MSKILVLPDIHMKSFMFDLADNIMKKHKMDYVVFTGDLVDEFYQSNNINLYKNIIERAIKFKHDHPNALFCWGNHDLAYFATSWSCVGHSDLHAFEIKDLLTQYEKEVEPKLVQKIDNYLISHAGITDEFIKQFNIKGNLTDIVDTINTFNINRLNVWHSPIWVRPMQTNETNTYYNNDCFQVVGHTPLKHLSILNNTWVVDTFSLDPTVMSPYGDQSLLSIDTESNMAYIYKNDKLADKVSYDNWFKYSY